MDMRSFFSLAALTVVLFCSLSSSPVLAQGEMVDGPWAWLQLDAELAERILFDGDSSAAGQLALDTHNALVAAIVDVTNQRGQDWVTDLRGELSQVLVASGFQVPPAPAPVRDGVVEVQP
jgi:hypothetical protein